MPLLNLRTTHLCIFSPQRVSTKFASFHAQSHPQHNNSETLWFIKVLCTLCIRTTTITTTSNNLDVFGCHYLKNHLDTYLAFEVIRHVSFSFKNPTLAFRFFSFIRTNLEMLHPFVTYDLLLRLFCQTDLLDLAQLVLDSMWVDGYLLDDDLFGLLVMSFANVGKFEVAMELFVSQELLFLRVGWGDEVGRRTSSFVYNDFLSLLVRVKRVDEAVRFFMDCILRSKYYLPDTCTFNIVLRGMCEVGELEKAFVLFNDMSSFGCSPDVISCNTLISGLSRNGNVDKADELLKKIRSQEGLSPDAVTYTSVISGYCKVGEMEKAFNLFGQMHNNGIKPNLITFNVLIDGFGKFGDMDAALNMYKRMLKFGYNPDVVTFTTLVDGHCRSGQVDNGLEIWTEMKAKNLLPNVYTFSVIINSLCKQNRLYEARDFLKQLKSRGDIVPRAFIYNPVIDGFCKAGNVEEANVIVREMEEKKCKPDKLTFTILIFGHCMKGKMLEAIRIFNKMLVVGCAPDSVTIKSLISCLRKAGMPNEAYKIKQAASEYLDTTITPSRRALPNTGIPVAGSK